MFLFSFVYNNNIKDLYIKFKNNKVFNKNIKVFPLHKVHCDTILNDGVDDFIRCCNDDFF